MVEMRMVEVEFWVWTVESSTSPSERSPFSFYPLSSFSCLP